LTQSIYFICHLFICHFYFSLFLFVLFYFYSFYSLWLFWLTALLLRDYYLSAQPGEREAEAALQPNTALVPNQSQSGQPSNHSTTLEKEGRLSPLSDVTFNPSGISTTQHANIKQAY
jgi:hypothetical protein